MRLVDADALYDTIAEDSYFVTCGLGLFADAGYGMTVKDIKRCIEETPVAREWISVKDRLPDGKGSYAICWRDKHGTWKAGVSNFGYSNSKPVFSCLDDLNHVEQCENVEYWLELPELPEDSNE